MSKPYFFVETLFKVSNKNLSNYLNFMAVDEEMDLMSIVGFNRPTPGELFQDYHIIWKHNKKQRKKEESYE